jgi:hypothetical protein
MAIVTRSDLPTCTTNSSSRATRSGPDVVSNTPRSPSLLTQDAPMSCPGRIQISPGQQSYTIDSRRETRDAWSTSYRLHWSLFLRLPPNSTRSSRDDRAGHEPGGVVADEQEQPAGIAWESREWEGRLRGQVHRELDAVYCNVP